MPAASIPGIELGAELGRGSHSVVVKGRRDGRDYAVKLPIDALTGADRELVYRRFLREGIALARARDASLPDVMEIGRSKGVPYLVMELATGETLAERLERGPLPEADVIRLASQLAGALGAIHAAGLVHRDVKPQNIVFDGRTGAARLIDLGSAALLHGAIGLVGTRAYAAPELLATDPRAADVRTDLYSLGRVLLECITGTRVSEDIAVRDQVPIPTRVADGLARIVTCLLAVDPNRRPASAAALLGDLDALIAGTAGKQERRARPESTAFFGRSPEIDQLRRAWADARRASRTIFLRGGPGAGKTRLAKAFIEDVTGAGAVVLTAACHPRDPHAFSAVRQLVDGYLCTCEELPPTERLHALAAVRKLGGEHGALLKLLSPAVARVFKDAPTIPASANAEQAFSESLSEFFGKLLRKTTPALVFVDDVQWLDAGSRRVLARAVTQVPKRALFLYGARTGDAAAELKRFEDLVVARKVGIELLPLGGDDLLEIARRFLSARELAPEVKQAILRLSDGTPLSVLELLRTLVDEGVLLPHWGRWQLDAKALAEMHLPRETASLLARRIRALEPVTRSVLACGAAMGMTFEVDLLESVASNGSQFVASALGEARRAELVEPDGAGAHRFIHHTVRDALLEGLDEQQAQQIHGRVATALDDAFQSAATPSFEVERASRGATADPDASSHDDGEGPDAGRLYRIAYHYGASGPAGPTERVAETNVAAGEAAVARFDNERAIEFFESAERALLRSNRTLAPAVRLKLGDAHLRSGGLDQALEVFESVLESARDDLTKAGTLVRIATIHQMRFDSKHAWNALEKAFRALGEELPKETPLAAATSASSWLRRGIARRLPVAAGSETRARDEMLCELYYEVGRVAFSDGKPGRLVQAAVRSLEPAERLGQSSSLVKSYLVYSFVLTALGFRAPGERYFESAATTARALGDPVAYAHALQIQHVIAAWDGRMSDAVDAASRCLLEYGNWRELSEFCALAWGVFQIETVRGRDLEAWRWLDLAIQRVNRHEGQPVVHEFLILAARAALVGLGRENETPLLLRRLQQVTVPVPKDGGTYLQTFGPRVRLITATGNVGAELEEICREFRDLGQDPKQAHLIVFEYYLHVAHARVQVCLRMRPEDRPQSIRDLDFALADLEAAAKKIPLCRAHAIVVRGYHHFFAGRHSEALLSYEEAERLAVAENAPWVLYAVHRGRAHVLKAQGRESAAKDQAILAESIAREHGSMHRARWVREEFDLRARRAHDGSDDLGQFSEGAYTQSDETTSLNPGGSRARRQLRALLRISQARAQELEPDVQVRLVVDELVQALRAERGYLFLTPALAKPLVESKIGDIEGKDLELVAARDNSGRDIGQAEDLDRATVHGALEIGMAAATEGAASFCLGTTPRRSAIAAPLVVDDLTAGVVYVDRGLAEGAFTEADGEILSALAGQVSIALELTRALRARERAEETLRAAEKMEAVARLARGIGHDVNNMLSAVSLTTEAIAQTPGASELIEDDILAIQSVIRGAGELTRRLRDMAQGDFGHPEVIRLSQCVERILPVIAGLLGAGITLETRLAGEGHVFIDAGQLDQIVMNLAINARDAMPSGGRLTIEVRSVVLEESYTREHPRVAPGTYVELSVADTGHGMDAHVRDKIFEPYFTTKRGRGGSGIGLSSVYWIVSRGGGHIDVTTAPGAGTTFSLYFPVTERPLAGRAPPAAREIPTDAGGDKPEPHAPAK